MVFSCCSCRVVLLCLLCLLLLCEFFISVMLCSSVLVLLGWIIVVFRWNLVGSVIL